MYASSSIIVALAAALFAAGCGGPDTAAQAGALTFDACQPLAIVADDGATAAQLDGIAAGIALWNQAAGTRLDSMRAGDAGAAGTAVVQLHFQGAAAPFHGLYDPSTAQVFINLDLTGGQQAITIAHEIGHAFGLPHVSPDARASLMNPGNLDVTPTGGDVDALATLWGRCHP